MLSDNRPIAALPRASEPSPRARSSSSEDARSDGSLHRVPGRRGPPPPTVAPGAGDSLFPEHFFTRPNSVIVYGPARSLVNLTLFAFAEATNPQFQWVDIGLPGEESVPSDPVTLGWVPEERLWRVDRPESLRPDDLTANLALFGLIRSDEPPAALAHVAEFLRLPDLSQRILASRSPNSTPNVVAVTNSQRVMSTFPPKRIVGILNVHLQAGFSVLVGAAEAGTEGKSLFDFVFRIDADGPNSWSTAQLVCERGIHSGPLTDGRPVRLEEIPLLAAVLSQAFGAK